MTYLLDVNVLIALIDPGHVQHDIAHNCFARDGERAWATCPITEKGVLRTDSYLLALAHAHGGQLATFDRRLVVTTVHGAAGALCLISK